MRQVSQEYVVVRRKKVTPVRAVKLVVKKAYNGLCDYFGLETPSDKFFYLGFLAFMILQIIVMASTMYVNSKLY